MEFYVVVCEGLHTSVGPFLGLPSAIEVAERLCIESVDGCKYLPVRFAFLGEVATEEKDDWRNYGGQYL
jgi:hypothetical protein